MKAIIFLLSLIVIPMVLGLVSDYFNHRKGILKGKKKIDNK